MLTTSDQQLRAVSRQFIEDERIYKEINLNPDAQFFDWEHEEFTRGRATTIAERARTACFDLHAGLKFNEDCVVVRGEGSEYIVKTATGLGHFLTQKVLRPQLFRKLGLKEKHGATYATLEKNECWNKILADLKSKTSDAFFRFTVAARADVLPSPAIIDQWNKRPHEGCYKCHKDCPATLAHVLNACQPMHEEMTRRNTRVARVVCDAILR
jgi:hypothetical protein